MGREEKARTIKREASKMESATAEGQSAGTLSLSKQLLNPGTEPLPVMQHMPPTGPMPGRPLPIPTSGPGPEVTDPIAKMHSMQIRVINPKNNKSQFCNIRDLPSRGRIDLLDSDYNKRVLGNKDFAEWCTWIKEECEWDATRQAITY